MGSPGLEKLFSRSHLLWMCFHRSANKMPEMPEVETLVRQLRKTIIGKRVAGVRLSGLPLRRPIADTLGAKLRGRRIRKILRRGKYLVVELEPKIYWLIHLGMSGRIMYHVKAGADTRHTHAVFQFSDATELEYRDHRRFGLLAAYDVQRLDQVPEIGSLGKDPLSPGFNGGYLWPQLQRSRQEIKSFLLDQRRVAGLGNIYVCESLFQAGIHPTRRCFTLTPEDTSRLIDAIREVLRKAIGNHGTSFSDFLDSEGRRGGHQSCLMVFQRDGEKCVRCGSRIRRVRQGNRSSFYCSHCQG
jgi:formamidopyrimidine-DNA glycosylase